MRAYEIVKPTIYMRASLVMKPTLRMRAKNAMKPDFQMRASGQVKPPSIMRAKDEVKPILSMRATWEMEPAVAMRAETRGGTHGGYASHPLNETHKKNASRSRCETPCSYASHRLFGTRFVHASHPFNEAQWRNASRKENRTQACHASHVLYEAQVDHACWEGGEAATPSLPPSLPPPFSYPRGGATSTRCGGGNCLFQGRLRAPIGGKKWRKETQPSAPTAVGLRLKASVCPNSALSVHTKWRGVAEQYTSTSSPRS